MKDRWFATVYVKMFSCDPGETSDRRIGDLISDPHRAEPSAYYQNSGSVPLASRISCHARMKMFQIFMETLRPGPESTILDVGVTSDSFYPESNYFEKMYPYPNQITCVGTEDGFHLTELYPGLKYLRVTGDGPLPFRSKEFDIVFSNATLEHVGSREAQAYFLKEICRVGKSFFVTTPNRWFPFEHHTGLPFLHYLPSKLFRKIIQKTRYKYWASESTLNILNVGELKKLFPKDFTLDVRVIRLLGIGSNLVACGQSRGLSSQEDSFDILA